MIPVTLDHIALDVADTARSVEFYGELLGTRVVATDDTHHITFLRLPDSARYSDIALHEHPDREAAYPSGQMRLAHTGWSIDDPALLVAGYDYFSAHSRVLLAADFGVSWSVMGADPDGNIVEFEYFTADAIDEQPGFAPLDIESLRATAGAR